MRLVRYKHVANRD